MVPCGLWQSWQRGASGLPCAASVPCVLSRYCPTTFSWQMEQSTLLWIVLHALTLDGVPPVWHCTQAMREWREPANSAALTYSDPVCPAPVPFSVGLEWQLRQSPLDIPCE